MLLSEKKPFVLYKVKEPITLNENTIVQKYELKASPSLEATGLSKLSCSCSFYHNYKMLCWH